jgi:hypothetical protein
LSIKQTTSEPTTQDLRIGGIDIVFGVLLDSCVDDSCMYRTDD